MPQNELNRLEAVNRFLNLEISKEREIQQIVDMAAMICRTKSALVTLLDKDTQYIKFRFGSNLKQTNRNDAFCNHTIKQEEMLIVHDALLDPRFVNNPLVTGDPHIRFYAGSKLTTHDGYDLGSLCVLDDMPKELTIEQQQIMELLSKQIIHIMEFDSSIKFLKEQYLQAKNSEDKLRSFFESSSACHLLIGKDLEVMAYNKSLASFVKKISSIEIRIGMNILDYIHLSYRDEFQRYHAEALKGVPNQTEKELDYPNEKIYWYMTFEPARNGTGEIIGVSYNATDITQRVAQTKMVFEQNESLKRIAFIQSHELRKPVSSILGFMKMFKADDYSAGKEDLMMMEKAVEDLDQKIRKIVNATLA